MPLTLELNEVLELILPPGSGEKRRKKPIPQSARTEFSQDPSSTRFENTPLTLSLKKGSDQIRIRGTADAVTKNEKKHTYTVEEEWMSETVAESVALREYASVRARFLALALANTKGLDQVEIRLTEYTEGRTETQTFVIQRRELSFYLAPFLQKALSLASLWAEPDLEIRFPYPALRDGQKQLIRQAWSAIKNSSKLFACAPTGIGKTLAVLYPALKALESKKISQVYYVSPKNPLKWQAASAVESLQAVRGLRTLVLNSKRSLCLNREEECLHRECAFFNSGSEKLAEALAYLSSFSCITQKELSAAAQEFSLCPFELALNMIPFCQVIIGDYNHVFDPANSVFRPQKDRLLLIDEAHNLPARIRENHTETVAPSDLDFLFRNPSHACKTLCEHVGALTAAFTQIEKTRNETKEYFSPAPHTAVARAVQELLPKVSFCLRGGFGPLKEEEEANVKQLWKKLKKYASLAKKFDATFATVYPPSGGCRIYLVDPRAVIRAATDPWRSSLFFSATLLPKEYYFDLLAGEEKDTFLELSSPFPRENFLIGICPVDVSFRQRFTTAAQICSIIHSAVSVKEGNYLVFLPSFEYLNLISQEYKRRFFDHRILIQQKNMTGTMRTDFLKALEEPKKGTLIGFCVLGGIFSEGLDLKGESLCGEIVVGTGFPPPSAESEAESSAYYAREMDGKSFAYTLPGWSRVLQAAGRVIRGENDRGFLILCDSRYRGEDMKMLFPEHWDEPLIWERDSQLKRDLMQFWK